MKLLLKRVGHYVDLVDDTFKSFVDLPHKLETRRPGEEIVSIGETIDFVFVIESGWAIRYRILDDGRRQILNFMLPGACFDMMSMASPFKRKPYCENKSSVSDDARPKSAWRIYCWS